jgi:acyl-CoA synthetase (NDP forming)
MNMEYTHELDRLFYPKSIAVVGATPKDKDVGSGNMFIEGAFEQKFKGIIYPIHPNADSILGFKAYPSVRDVPGEVDLVILSIPLKFVLPVMADCVARGVKFVHMFTAGFSETGRAETAEIEQEILAVARKNGIRIIGPNCMGVYCPEGGISFQGYFPSKPGPVGFVSQSGSIVNGFVEKGVNQGLNFSKIVSFGNAGDLQPQDFLAYLGQDPKTEVIGSYIEGLKDGRAFLETAKTLTRKKPLVVMKGGQTEGGTRAILTHTASMAGSPKIWHALCEQSGIIPVNSTDEMILTLAALQRMPKPEGLKAAIFGEFGGGSVLMTDVAEKEGLKVPRLSEDTIQRLEEFMPQEGQSVKNPLDAGMALFSSFHFTKLMEVLRDDPVIDILVFVQQLGFFTRRGSGRSGLRRLKEMTMEAKEKFNKPIFLVLNLDESPGITAMRQELQEGYHQAGLATFPSFEMAVRVCVNLYRYGEYLARTDESSE